MNLEEILGIRILEAVAAKISEDYQGGEMDIRYAIIHRPDLFERAFIGMLGDIDERILGHVWCSKLCEQFNLHPALTYHTAGDLIRCIEAIHARESKKKSY